MGKAKKKRQSGARVDPTGVSCEENGSGDQEVPRSEEEVISNITEQLLSSNSETKVCGCQSLSNLTSDKLIKKLVILKKIVRVLGPLLLESDKMVTIAAAGALRNISALDPDTADEMVKQDVMTPIEQFFTKFHSFPPDQLKEDDISLLTEVVNLVWNLVEASPTAYSQFTGSNLLELALSLLSLQSSILLVMAVLSLLAAACDQNKKTSEKVLQHGQQIESLLAHPSSSRIRINSCLLLVTALDEGILQHSTFPKLMQTINTTISLDSRKQICDWSSSAPVTEADDEAEMDVDLGDADFKLKECEDTLLSQQTCLEILTNLCSLGEEGADWEAVDSDDEATEEIEDDIVDSTPGEGVENVNAAPPTLVEAVVGLKLVPEILLKANPLPENVLAILNSSIKGRKLMREHENLRTRTFLCLSNFMESLDLDDLGGKASLLSTWNSLGTIIVQSKDEKLLEAASSCMRSVTSKLCKFCDKNDWTLTQSDLEALVKVAEHSEIVEVRMNMVNVIGDICVMLSKSLKETATIDVFSLLVGWIVEGGCKDPDLRVVAESLDKLFDAFSEDDTDIVFFRLNLLARLRGLAPSIRIKLSQQKRHLSEESLGLVGMARLNLQRFIKYKEKRQKS